MTVGDDIEIHPENSADHCCRGQYASHYRHHFHYFIHLIADGGRAHTCHEVSLFLSQPNAFNREYLKDGFSSLSNNQKIKKLKSLPPHFSKSNNLLLFWKILFGKKN